MLEERACMIGSKVQLICPGCGEMIELPMCQAVNGEEIICPHCQQKIIFGM